LMQMKAILKTVLQLPCNKPRESGQPPILGPEFNSLF
jgi:hypothetical protein